MAVEARPLNTTLQLLFDMGTDEDGKKITRRRSYTNVKTDAADQDVYDVAVILTDLQTQSVVGIQTIDKTDLVNAG